MRSAGVHELVLVLVLGCGCVGSHGAPAPCAALVAAGGVARCAASLHTVEATIASLAPVLDNTTGTGPGTGPGCEVTVDLSPLHTLVRPLHLTGTARLPAHCARVRWRGPAVISGGVRVTGWRAAKGASQSLVAPLPPSLLAAGVNTTRQLYTAGLPGNRTFAPAPGLGLGPQFNTTAGPAGLLTNSTLPQRWANPGDAELVYGGKFQQSRCRVLSVQTLDPATHDGFQSLVRVVEPCWGFGLALRQVTAAPVLVANLLPPPVVGLEPGQWAQAGAQIHYRPRNAAERANLLGPSPDAVVPLSAGLIVARGVAGHTFEGIEFRHSLFQSPSGPTGFLERYSNVQYKPCEPGRPCHGGAHAGDAGCAVNCSLAMAPAAVAVRRSRDVHFVNCTFRNLGGWGLSFADGTWGSSVSASLFTNTSGGAIQIGNVNETQAAIGEAHYTGNVHVADNVIQRVGLDYWGASGIFLFSAIGSVIEHNYLAQTPYTAVSFNWPVPQSATYGMDNALLANEITDTCTWGIDGGAVHTIGPALNSTLRGNYVHGQHHGTKTVYVDNTSSNYNVTHHVIDDCPQSFWLFFQQECDPQNRSRCYNAGTNDHASDCYVRNAPPSPFPYDTHGCSVSDIEYFNASEPLPAAAHTIMAAAGPRYASPATWPVLGHRPPQP